MQVIYNPNNGEVYRIISDDKTYSSFLEYASYKLEAYNNSDLVQLLSSKPDKFTFNLSEESFYENLGDGSTKKYVVVTKFYNKDQDEFLGNIPSLEETLKMIDNANDIDSLKSICVLMSRALYALARKVTG